MFIISFFFFFFIMQHFISFVTQCKFCFVFAHVSRFHFIWERISCSLADCCW